MILIVLNPKIEMSALEDDIAVLNTKILSLENQIASLG